MPLIASTGGKARVILGLMTFGKDETAGARITEVSELGRVLDRLQERGYGELDTARVYVNGTQEAFTREARWKERGFTLATKVKYPAEDGDNAPAKVEESVEQSLKELGTDCVDVSLEDYRPPPPPLVYFNRAISFSPGSPTVHLLTLRPPCQQILYLHCPDRATPFAETLEAVNRLHKAGKFVRLGLSNFTAAEVAEVVMTCKYNGWVRPTVYQAMYNAITRGIDAELVPACRRYGIDIVVYNPIAGGLFRYVGSQFRRFPGISGRNKDTNVGGPHATAARSRARTWRCRAAGSTAARTSGRCTRSATSRTARSRRCGRSRRRWRRTGTKG